MASIPCALIVLLICLSQDHMGIQGISSTVFSSVGGKATLPCDKAVRQDPCNSTTWIYNSYASKDTIEVFGLGKIHSAVPKPRAERLSLLPSCSLHITDVTTEDAGLYTCQQYLREGGAKEGEDHQVHLPVLHVSASPSETEMEADSHVTLRCLLQTYDNCAGSLGDKSKLRWVDETGSVLKKSDKHQISSTSMCGITLAEKLRAPDSSHTQRTWRCQLTAGGKVQTSATYTIRAKGHVTKKPTVTPKTHSTEKQKSKSHVTKKSTVSPTILKPHSSALDGHLIAGVVVSVILLAGVLVIFVVIRKRRTNAGGEQNHKSTQSRTSATAVQSVQPANSSANEEADLHYAAFQHLNPAPAGPSAKQSDDSVTYSTIVQLSGGEEQNNSRPADPSDMYATVRKNDKTQN